MRLIPLALAVAACHPHPRTPTEITWGGRDFHLETHHADEAECFDLVTASVTEFTLCGSLDTLCDPPHAFVTDADGDGQLDVVITTCSGTHVVSWRDGAIGERRVEALPRGLR